MTLARKVRSPQPPQMYRPEPSHLTAPVTPWLVRRAGLDRIASTVRQVASSTMAGHAADPTMMPLCVL